MSTRGRCDREALANTRSPRPAIRHVARLVESRRSAPRTSSAGAAAHRQQHLHDVPRERLSGMLSNGYAPWSIVKRAETDEHAVSVDARPRPRAARRVAGGEKALDAVFDPLHRAPSTRAAWHTTMSSRGCDLSPKLPPMSPAHRDRVAVEAEDARGASASRAGSGARSCSERTPAAIELGPSPPGTPWAHRCAGPGRASPHHERGASRTQRRRRPTTARPTRSHCRGTSVERRLGRGLDRRERPQRLDVDVEELGGVLGHRP